MALDVTTIMAHALDNNKKDIGDCIINNNLLSAWLNANGRKKMLSGGKSIHEKVMWNEAAGFAWMPKDQEISLTTTDFMTDAVYQIRALAGPLKVYHMDKMMASGESQILDLVETTIENAKSTMSNRMGTALMGDNGTSTEVLHGIQHIISATSGVECGGISPSDVSRWEPYVRGTAVAFNTSQAGINAMSLLVTGAARNEKDFPDLLLTSATVWGYYLLSATNVARIIDSKVGSLGYKTLDFMGIPVGYDANCPTGVATTGVSVTAGTGTMYAINSKYMRLNVLEGGDFVTSEWSRVQGQLADYCTMHFYGQLTTNNREKLGVQTNISA